MKIVFFTLLFILAHSQLNFNLGNLGGVIGGALGNLFGGLTPNNLSTSTNCPPGQCTTPQCSSGFYLSGNICRQLFSTQTRTPTCPTGFTFNNSICSRLV
jgi:hypothetical protein